MSPVQCVTDVPVHSSLRKAWLPALGQVACPGNRIADTDPAVHALCGEHVALLGEPPVHGFGNTLEFKAQLVRRLVDECLRRIVRHLAELRQQKAQISILRPQSRLAIPGRHLRKRQFQIADAHTAQPAQQAKGDRTDRSPNRPCHPPGKQSNAMNEEPDDGELCGFADADLVGWRRALFNFAQAYSLPIPNQRAEKQKGRLQ